jgi:hypothetical protein
VPYGLRLLVVGDEVEPNPAGDILRGLVRRPAAGELAVVLPGGVFGYGIPGLPVLLGDWIDALAERRRSAREARRPCA